MLPRVGSSAAGRMRRAFAQATCLMFALTATPAFAADPIFGHGGTGLIQSWMHASRPVEFHLYEQGGHGFGMYPKTTTSTGWFDAFVSWMRMHGWLTAAH